MSEANGPDKSLLRWQEGGELYEAEERVLKVFREGWKTGEGLVVEDGRMIFVVPPEDSNAPEKPAEEHTADDWQGAILRAEFLRDLFLGNYGKFDPRLIMISFAWIEGRLDLNYCESRLPLAFSRCIFSDGISLRNSIIPELQLPGCEVRSSLFAQDAKVSSSVHLRDGFKSADAVDLNGADIGGPLACSGGHFEEGLKAQNLKTGQSVFLRDGFKSAGAVDLNGADIGGQLDCRGGHFEEGLTAQSLKTGADVFLRGGFKSVGAVDLNGADIGGQLACDGGHFEKGLTAQSLKTGASVFLRGGFKSVGAVDLNGADIGGSLSLEDAKIEFLNLRNAEVRGALQNLQKWPRNGTADGFSYQTIAPARGWKTGWKWVRDMSQSSEPRLSLLALWSWYRDTASEFRRTRTDSNLHPVWFRIGFGLAFIVPVLMFIAFALILISFRVILVIKKLFQVVWSPDFSPQPYEQLMSVYRRMGHTNWARNVGFQLEKRRSKAFKGLQLLTWRPWYVILRWTIGYGYKPFRFLWWAAGLVATGFLLFSSGHPNGIVSRHTLQAWQEPAFLNKAFAFLENEWTDGIVSRHIPPSWQETAFLNKAFAFLENEWIPSDGNALSSEFWAQSRKPPPDYLPFNPLVYSLESTFPVLNLGQLEKWHPSNRFLLGLRWACTLMGTLLLAILALFGAGVLGPRWRSGDEGG